MNYRCEKPFEYLNKLQDLKVKCLNCGHSSVMPVFVDTKICSHCKHKVINNSKEYFNYKLRKMVKEKEMGKKNNYELEELVEKERTGYVIRYKYYKVINYDNNEDKLKEYIKELNKESCFNITYSIHHIENGDVIIEEEIDTLD